MYLYVVSVLKHLFGTTDVSGKMFKQQKICSEGELLSKERLRPSSTRLSRYARVY